MTDTLATWYEVVSWSGEVRPIEVLGETEKCLIIGAMGRRVFKISRYSRYFRTRREAKAYAVSRAEKHLAALYENVERAKAQLAAAKELPDD